MLSISDDSASARNPTWPRLTPSSGMSWVNTHSAPRRMVPSPPSTTISSMPSSPVSDCASSVTRSAAVDGPQILRRQSGDDPGRRQPLDEPVGGLHRGRSTHVGQHGHPTGLRLGHLRQHRRRRRHLPGPDRRSPGIPARGSGADQPVQIDQPPRAARVAAARRTPGCPSAPSSPLATAPCGGQPSSAARSATAATASRCSPADRTTPPAPSRLRPTSNWGFTSSSISPDRSVTAADGQQQG